MLFSVFKSALVRNPLSVLLQVALSERLLAFDPAARPAAADVVAELDCDHELPELPGACSAIAG